MFKILVINPGSTSTKIAVYEDEKEALKEVLLMDILILKDLEMLLISTK